METVQNLISQIETVQNFISQIETEQNFISQIETVQKLMSQFANHFNIHDASKHYFTSIKKWLHFLNLNRHFNVAFMKCGSIS